MQFTKLKASCHCTAAKMQMNVYSISLQMKLFLRSAKPDTDSIIPFYLLYFTFCYLFAFFLYHIDMETWSSCHSHRRLEFLRILSSVRQQRAAVGWISEVNIMEGVIIFAFKLSSGCVITLLQTPSRISSNYCF